MNFGNVKPSVVSWVTVGLMSVTFIVLLKWLVSKWPVPGVTQIANTV